MRQTAGWKSAGTALLTSQLIQTARETRWERGAICCQPTAECQHAKCNRWRQHGPVSGAPSPARAVETLVSFLAPVCGGILEVQLEAAVIGEKILALSLSSGTFSAMGTVEWG